MTRPRPVFAAARTVVIKDIFFKTKEKTKEKTKDKDKDTTPPTPLTITFTNTAAVAAKHFDTCLTGCDKCTEILEIAQRMREVYDANFAPVDIGNVDFAVYKNKWVSSAVRFAVLRHSPWWTSPVITW